MSPRTNGARSASAAAFPARHSRRSTDSGVGLRALERLPHGRREPRALTEDPEHLGDRTDPIGEEHQTELAHDRIELVVVEREIAGVALDPPDPWFQPLGDREHPGTEVDARHRTGRPDATDRRAGAHTRPARDIEHSVPGRHAGCIEHGVGPLSEDRADVQVLVRRGAGDRLFQLGRHRPTSVRSGSD